MTTTARFADYVRLNFAEMRDSLTHSVRTLIAAQSLPPLRREDPPTNLRSGATVKHLVKAFENHAIQAVDACRSAAKRSPPLEAHLRTALPAEVDALAEIVSSRLIGLDLWDSAAQQLLAERRDRSLADRRPPVVPAPRRWVPDWMKADARVIVTTVVGGLILALLIFILRIPGPRDAETKKGPGAVRVEASKDVSK